MTKPYVKLRESGKVVEVESIDIEMAVTINNGRWGRTAINTIDCDLCDEQGRLLVPQDERLSQATKLLQDLADLQNGAPLEQHRKEWEEVMEQVYQFLNKEEQR